MEEKLYNYDIIIDGEKMFTIYNIHLFNDKYSKKHNDLCYKLKSEILDELTTDNIFKNILFSLIKIYKNNFDLQTSIDFSNKCIFINDNEDIENIENIDIKFLNDFKNLTLLRYLQLSVIIKFDEIIIKNSLNNEGLLKDIYVKFDLNFTKINDGYNCNLNDISLKGLRSTRYNYELESNYIHSHLPLSNQFEDFTNFCIGTGPLALVMIELKRKDFNIIKFKGFLYQIKSYLEWESIEGGPYIRLSNRNNSHNSQYYLNTYCFYYNYRISDYSIYCSYNHSHYSFNTIENNKEVLLNELIKYVNINLNNNAIKDINNIDLKISLENEKKLVQFIENLDNSFFGTIDKNYLLAVKKNNEYYKYNLSNIINNSDKENKFLLNFKEKKIYSKILNNDNNNKPVLLLNPYFKEKLLSIIKNKIIKNERTRKCKIENYRVKEYKDTSIYIR